MVSDLNAARAAADNWLAWPGVLRQAFGNQERQGKPSSEVKMTGLPAAGTVQPQLLSPPLPYLTARENVPEKKQAALAAFFPRGREKSINRTSYRDDSGSKLWLQEFACRRHTHQPTGALLPLEKVHRAGAQLTKRNSLGKHSRKTVRSPARARLSPQALKALFLSLVPGTR